MTTATLPRRTTAWLLTSACLTLAVMVEVGWIHPLRAPGHRALPTVTALLSFARLLPLPAVVGYALLAPTIICLVRPHQGTTVAVYLFWAVGAACAIALRPAKRRGALAALAFGAGFGLLRALLLTRGTAHGDPSRLIGNVAFGMLGAVLALLILRPVEKT